MITVEEVLRSTTFRRIDIEFLLDESTDSWVRFDPVLGYVPDDTIMKDGMDGSHSTYRFAPTGERSIVNYADRPCRINTYGDSFTFCQQVSDGETWQECLAAHIGEPVRNYGNGGYGVNQAYLRAMRMEATECAAEHIILGVYDDDHIRSLDVARWPRTQWYRRDVPITRATPMHGLPWSHVRYDLDRGCFVDVPGVCKTPDDLLALCDPDHYYETLKDDQIIRLFVLELGGEVDSVEDLQALASTFGLDIDLTDPDRQSEDATLLHRTYGMKCSEHLLGRWLDWCEQEGRKLMVALLYSPNAVTDAVEGRPRTDQPFLDHLDRRSVPCVDLLKAHVEDYAAFNLPLEDYYNRYFVHAAGAAVFQHYSAPGNFFAAMAMKDTVVDQLDPKPAAYPDR